MFNGGKIICILLYMQSKCEGGKDSDSLINIGFKGTYGDFKIKNNLVDYIVI